MLIKISVVLSGWNQLYYLYVSRAEVFLHDNGDDKLRRKGVEANLSQILPF